MVAASHGDHVSVRHTVENRKCTKACTRTPVFAHVDRDADALLAQETGEEGSGRFRIPLTKEYAQGNTVFVTPPHNRWVRPPTLSLTWWYSQTAYPMTSHGT
ncbi:hypothetical protein GCM10008960_33130 [Deinococcus sedimenti]|uniref:Uncharacterized protein n=1 Tax=Deinococcus sedimenti TaxID=1867090 RepID=A0ABQ2S7W2_9DEIO|nr:hypothetical protein GCM10008960_33130 [Deinococcus sedimenti]